MRKIVPALLIVLLVPVGYFLASSNGSTAIDGDTGKVPQGQGIKVVLDRTVYSPDDTLTLKVTNGESVNATTGYAFTLYRLENGEWRELQLNLVFVEIAVIIKPGESWEQKVDLSRLNLEPGHYKIVKEVYIEGTKVKVGTEFDIKE